MLRYVKRFFFDETGAVTIEWVVLTAGVITLGIAGYGAFKIDMDSSSITVARHSSGGTLPMVDGGNAITRLIKTVELELKMFRACNFASAGAQFSAVQIRLPVHSMKLDQADLQNHHLHSSHLSH